MFNLSKIIPKVESLSPKKLALLAFSVATFMTSYAQESTGNESSAEDAIITKVTNMTDGQRRDLVKNAYKILENDLKGEGVEYEDAGTITSLRKDHRKTTLRITMGNPAVENGMTTVELDDNDSDGDVDEMKIIKMDKSEEKVTNKDKSPEAKEKLNKANIGYTVIVDALK